MPEKNTIAVLINPGLALRAGLWMVDWKPPEPTALGGGYLPHIETSLRELGLQLVKAGRRRGGRRYIAIDASRAAIFVKEHHPCTPGSVRLWPREPLKLRRRIEGALRRKGRVGRPALKLERLRRIVAGEIAYADDRNLRRLQKRQREVERRREYDIAFKEWAAANIALGGSVIDPALPPPKSP